MTSKYKPGDGWFHVAPQVYENATGVRILLLGLCRTASHQFISENNAAKEFIRINGGNRRRGLMAWARSITADKGDV